LLIDRLAGLNLDELEKKNLQRIAERQKLIDDLLGNSSRAALLSLALHQNRLPESTREAIVAAAVAHGDAAIRDLFEPFVPEEQRVKRLGDAIKSAELLKLAGDAARGKELFHKTAGVQCRSCHRIAGDGTELGPDLSQIGKKLDRAKLLESILDPSRNIEPQFVTWVVETTAGKVVTGLLVRKDETEIIVKDAQNKQHRFAMSEVEGAHPQQKSLMPDLLLREMTAQQVADLLAYLASLK
jgi:putative heme-binding domain-containing protein